LLVNELMEALIRRVKASQDLRRELYAATLHTTLSGQAMVRSADSPRVRIPGRQVTLAYHKKLGDDWRGEAERIGYDLAEECQSCTADRVNVTGRAPTRGSGARCAGSSREQKIVAGRTT